ncbi:class I glutamine amidotransferase-like protein [Durotheca rogersii]|uniref:class I glutamine amidotransferase-like protein n=1 Tax=Durotheca rogersii TaxID=419775 RepID=UPI00221FB649|nr:class I glutamine amidotransferase-like protein [Durotheca rogersii]KAI5861179.1 class I glutamine amidotransferase-like protein [Durotheca rogersii]
MKVLIAKCYTTQQAWGTLMIESFVNHVRRSQPSAEIDVRGLVDGDSLPEPSRHYDLIILTGGTDNLIADTHPPGETKLLGLCWGHQCIQVALGGELGVVPGGPRVGVEEIVLSRQGQEFFREKPDLMLHKFHKRYVTAPAPGFSALASNNEIFLSSTGRILSFQSHPELTEEISQRVIDGSEGVYDTGNSNHDGIVLKGIDHAHDGQQVWDRILDWSTQA